MINNLELRKNCFNLCLIDAFELYFQIYVLNFIISVKLKPNQSKILYYEFETLITKY